MEMVETPENKIPCPRCGSPGKIISKSGKHIDCYCQTCERLFDPQNPRTHFPTADEIAARAAEVRAQWSAREERDRCVQKCPEFEFQIVSAVAC